MMSNLKYSEDHEWLLVNDHGSVTVGISDYAQRQLGDVVYVELPAPGRQVGKDEEIAVVESVKAASDVKSPISGTVEAVNEALADEPEKVNADPLGKGWFLKLRPADAAEIEALMDEAAYESFIANL